jgi:nucleotide-binding universal stress UspA family protein
MAIPIQNILVPLDGSHLAKEALVYAQGLAQQAHANLTLLRVVPSISDELAIQELVVPNYRELAKAQQKANDEAAEGLQQLVDELKFHHFQVESMVDVGDPAEKIIDCATKNAVDLIVMATHGRTGLRKLAMGSVASQVSTAAPCPVLLVRSRSEN